MTTTKTELEDLFVVVGNTGRLVDGKIAVTQTEFRKIEALLDAAVVEARLDEIKRATRYVHPHELQDRIAALSKRQHHG